MGRPDLAIIGAFGSRALARESVRNATAVGRDAVVIDLDGSYVPVGSEPVLTPAMLGIPERELHLRAAALEANALDAEFVERLVLAASSRLDRPLEPLRAGVLLVGSNGSTLDLSAFDPERPWVIDPRDPAPATLLSADPTLARFVAEVADRLRADASASAGRRPEWDMMTTSLEIPIDAPLRHLYRQALEARTEEAVPDPYDPSSSTALREWLITPGTEGRPARYLEAILATRPDLREAFPRVPGPSTAAFLAWADTHGRREGYPIDLLAAAVAAGPVERPPTRAARPEPGVTVVGYLTGELGIGESARQLVNALSAANVPHATRPVDLHLVSTRRPAAEAEGATAFDTTVICVNADLTATVAATIPDLTRRSYRIGMWYWEVEDFPASLHGGFAAVDEVWVATDFVRRAIEPHSPVPVRTLTPPLPQRGPEPVLTRADLGLPDAPVFLFSFDYLSTAERKNPVGLVEAFERAFRPGEGPVLVIKSINADKRVADAERLRLRAAARPDVILLENYLEPQARDALIAHCDCYVSLHRSEGLGLTMAEAMSWGKPVIATAYSGNLQFMTPENSFLVAATPTRIPEHAEPYPAGGVWAEPDVDAAAAAMRMVVEAPEQAAARAARAAWDIATLHNADVAGRQVAARLGELARERRARSRASLVQAARTSLRAAATALRDELR